MVRKEEQHMESKLAKQLPEGQPELSIHKPKLMFFPCKEDHNDYIVYMGTAK